MVLAGFDIANAGVSSLGTYSSTTVIKGLPAAGGVHSVFQSSAAPTANQYVNITSRHYSADTKWVGMLRASNELSTNFLDIGRGDGGANTACVTDGRIYAFTDSTTVTTGSLKMYWSAEGVVVGTNPSVPIVTEDFRVQTTAFANAFTVKSNGHVYMANVNQRLKIGNSPNMELYTSGGGTNYVQGVNGALYLRTTNAANVIIEVPAAQTIDLQVNAVTTTQVNLNGIVLPLIGAFATPNIYVGSSGQWRMYHSGDSYLYNSVGGYYLLQSAANNIYMKVPTGQSVEVQVNSVLTAYMGANGLVCPLDAAGVSTANVKVGLTGVLSIYQTGANATIYNDTGPFTIQNGGTGALNLEVPTGQLIYLKINSVATVQVNGGGLQIPAGNRIHIIGQAGDVSAPLAGDIEYNTTSNKHRGYDGTIWNDLY